MDDVYFSDNDPALDRVNMDYQSLDDNETINNESLDEYLEKKLQLPQVSKTDPFSYEGRHLTQSQRNEVDNLLRKYKGALNDGMEIRTFKLFEAAVHPSPTLILTR